MAKGIIYRIQAFRLDQMVFMWKNKIMRSSSVPCHVVFLEMHLMGVERYMYRFADRETFIKAAMTEDMYDMLGLVTRFGMN